MTLFAKMKESFSVNWGTVLVGWNDYSQQLSQITFDEIKVFACERLESSDCTQLEENMIIQLFSYHQNEFDKKEICDLLVTLSHLSNAKINVEERKWRVIQLGEMLASIPSNPIDGLLALTDFWASYDYPSDSPHIVQGKDNEIPPTTYYTDSFFQNMLSTHKEWIVKEMQSIRDIESGKLILQEDGTAVLKVDFVEE